MRVVHVNTAEDSGGAALGAYGLHASFLQAGVDSWFLVRSRRRQTARVVRTATFLHGKGRTRLDALAYLGYKKKPASELFSANWFPTAIQHDINRLKPDIVNLHWVGAGYMNVSNLLGVQAPLVWTLRDMWPMTGGCHYSLGCERFRDQCGQCPQLGSSRYTDVTHSGWALKSSVFKKISLTVVALSSWIAKKAAQSSLLGAKSIHVIPNSVDADVFFPEPATRAKHELGLPLDKKIVVFGAVAPTRDPRKGFEKLAAALNGFSQAEKEKTMLCVFGEANTAHLDGDFGLGLETRRFGYLPPHALRRVLSAGDVMVVPSLEEALGKTAQEASACGTPVVSFADTGPADVIEHKATGYLAAYGDSNDLLAGIRWVLECVDEEMRASTRAIAVRKFAPASIAARYRALYEQLLSEAPFPFAGR